MTTTQITAGIATTIFVLFFARLFWHFWLEIWLEILPLFVRWLIHTIWNFFVFVFENTLPQTKDTK